MVSAGAAPQPDRERLWAEIEEQPAALSRLLGGQARAVAEVARAAERRAPGPIVLVARGSSDNAAIYGRYLFEICNQRLVSLASASEVTLYESGPALGGCLVIGVSQSGRGEDVVTYVRAARERGALTAAIVNDSNSPLASAAEWVLDCAAGPEVSVPATKTVTTQMLVLAMLSQALADPGTDFKVLAGVPGAAETALARRDAAGAAAARLRERSADAVIGRGFAFPVGLELALKLKETAREPAEPFSAADFFHGPIALVDPRFAAVVVDVGGRSTAPAERAAAEVERRGGHLLRLRAGRVGGPEGALALDVDLDEPFAPIPALVLGPLLAVSLAEARGLDPARPRGLTKVTSTR